MCRTRNLFHQTNRLNTQSWGHHMFPPPAHMFSSGGPGFSKNQPLHGPAGSVGPPNWWSHGDSWQQDMYGMWWPLGGTLNLILIMKRSWTPWITWIIMDPCSTRWHFPRQSPFASDRVHAVIRSRFLLIPFSWKESRSLWQMGLDLSVFFQIEVNDKVPMMVLLTERGKY